MLHSEGTRGWKKKSTQRKIIHRLKQKNTKTRGGWEYVTGGTKNNGGGYFKEVVCMGGLGRIVV